MAFPSYYQFAPTSFFVNDQQLLALQEVDCLCQNGGMKVNKRVLLPLTIALGLSLTGCANPLQGLIEGGANKVTENILEQATGGEVKLGGTSLPDGFPSEVPTPNGKLLQSAVFSGVYTLAFEVDEKEVESFLQTLESQGFEGGDGMESEEGYIKAFHNDEWSVGVTGTKAGADSHLALIVTPIDDE